MIFALLAAYAIVGTVVGRILYRARLGNSARYQTAWDRYNQREGLITTFDHTSAQTYGLWSIPLWPLVLAIWIVQAPTPDEKRAQRTEELKNATEALEKVAHDYDLKLRV
jgi:cytochrome c-type biogenesis protein CcmH/NrfF